MLKPERDNAPYPWQSENWQALIERQRTGRLPHALLFTGPAGIGKRDFAIALARSLLCLQPDAATGQGCGSCRSCLLLTAESHPDYQLLEPEEEGKGIGIEVIRQLINSQSLKAQYGEQKVVILNPADRINHNAANALLKTLEEPSRGTILILITERPMSLLPTIRSRCQQIPFRTVDRALALDWLGRFAFTIGAEELLAMACGAPLQAVALAESGQLTRRAEFLAELLAIAEGHHDPLLTAEKWGDATMASSLIWFYHWLTALIRYKQTGIDEASQEGAEIQQLLAMATAVEIQALFHILDAVQETLRLLTGQLNRQVLMEGLLLTWQRLFLLKARR